MLPFPLHIEMGQMRGVPCMWQGPSSDWLLLAHGRLLQGSTAQHMRGQACSTDLVGRVSGASNGVVNVDCRGRQAGSSLFQKSLEHATWCLAAR